MRQSRHDEFAKRSTKLEQEYTLLRVFNEMSGKNIKFEDFQYIRFTVHKVKDVLAINCKELCFFKVFNLSSIMEEFLIWPTMLADFLRANGAKETDHKGKLLPPKQLPGLIRPTNKQDPVKEWVTNGEGFWQLVTVEE